MMWDCSRSTKLTGGSATEETLLVILMQIYSALSMYGNGEAIASGTGLLLLGVDALRYLA